MGMGTMDYFGVFGEKRPVPGGCNTLAASTGARCGRFDQSKAKPPFRRPFWLCEQTRISAFDADTVGSAQVSPTDSDRRADPTGCVNIRRIPVRRGISSKRHVAVQRRLREKESARRPHLCRWRLDDFTELLREVFS